MKQRGAEDDEDEKEEEIEKRTSWRNKLLFIFKRRMEEMTTRCVFLFHLLSKKKEKGKKEILNEIFLFIETKS